MTDEDAFETALDANPEDWALRLVYADWLQERDDDRAAGMRWMGGNEKRPYDWNTNRVIRYFNSFDWKNESTIIGWAVPSHCMISPELFARLVPQNLSPPAAGTFGWADYRSRREAEDALCRATARGVSG